MARERGSVPLPVVVTEAPSPNPLATSTSVTVSVPESVEVNLVDAAVLADYEIWSLLTSILSSAVVGFAVAYCQAEASKGQGLFWTSVIFGLLMLVTGSTAIAKRRKLSRKTRRVSFSIGDPIK